MNDLNNSGISSDKKLSFIDSANVSDPAGWTVGLFSGFIIAFGIYQPEPLLLIILFVMGVMLCIKNYYNLKRKYEVEKPDTRQYIRPGTLKFDSKEETFVGTIERKADSLSMVSLDLGDGNDSSPLTGSSALLGIPLTISHASEPSEALSPFDYLNKKTERKSDIEIIRERRKKREEEEAKKLAEAQGAKSSGNDTGSGNDISTSDGGPGIIQ